MPVNHDNKTYSNAPSLLQSFFVIQLKFAKIFISEKIHKLQETNLLFQISTFKIDKIYFKINDIKDIPQNLGNCENLDEIEIIYDMDEISNDKKNIFILGNYQYNRIFLKNIMQNIVYNKEPNEKIVYVK